MRDKILDTAGKMFLKLGFKSVTMDDIASELGVSKKTIYKYFENKHTLVEQSTSLIHESCLNVICAIEKQKFNAIAENFEINKMFKEMFKNLGESPLYQLKKYYPILFEKVIAVKVKTFYKCVKNNIENGIREGFYREDTNIDVNVNFYLSIVFDIHEKNSSQQVTMHLEREALLYHTRAIATTKGIQELDKQLNN